MSEVKEFIKQIEAFLHSRVLEEAEDEYSNFLSLLMGWMLCPNIRGWPDYDDWSGPPLQHSEEAWTGWLWKVLAHLQNIIHVHRPSKAAAFLEIWNGPVVSKMLWSVYPRPARIKFGLIF